MRSHHLSVLFTIATGHDICREWDALARIYGAKLHSQCLSPPDLEPSIQDQFIVIYNDEEPTSLTASKLAGLVSASEVNVTGTYDVCIKGFSAKLSPAGLRRIVRDPSVKFVEQEREFTSVGLQRNPIWNLDRIDQQSASLNGVYDTGNVEGRGTHIYILDTGINQHDDYAGRLSNGANFIGDGRGWGDCNGHGTHCAGTAAGTRWGVAKQATLHAVRILGCSGSGTSSSVLSGVEWVIREKERNGWPAIASMSLGSGRSTAINRAVQKATRAGVVVVAAAGNENTDACRSSPASAPEAITVGSTTINDQRSSFSNYGSCVDIFAPGSNIRSADFRSRTGSRTLSGTSMACPHVSGAAALLLGSENSLSPAAVAQQLQSRSTRGAIRDTRGSNLFLRTAYGTSRPLPPLPTPPAPQPTRCITAGGPRPGVPCSFPFTFNSRTYTGCTTDGDPDGRAWCSTLTRNGRHVQGNWGYCPSRCSGQPSRPTYRPTNRPPTAQPTPRPTFRPTFRPSPAPPPAGGCRTTAGARCILPFVFGRKTYNGCTGDADPSGRLWCSTRVDSSGRHVRGNWGYCERDCPADGARRPSGSRPSAAECKILELVNAFRRENGLGELGFDQRLQKAAELHSSDMQNRNYFSHDDPDGVGVDERVLNQGYPWRSVAENIAVGYPTATAVFEGWKDSPGHRRNILCTSCTDTGIGIFQEPNSKWGYYYTQVFGSADGPPEPTGSCPAAAETERTCKTNGGPQPFAPCDLPFDFDGISYTTCIKHAFATQAWCPTNNSMFSVDPNGAKDWGYCAEGCEQTIISCDPSHWWCVQKSAAGMISGNGVSMAIQLPNLTIKTMHESDAGCYDQSSNLEVQGKDKSLAIGLGIGLPTIMVAAAVIYFRFYKRRAD